MTKRVAQLVPVIDAHKVLVEAGILVPSSFAIVGDMRSERGALIDADVVRLLPGVKVVKHGEAIFTRTNGITGEWSCSCQQGSGSCSVVSTEDPDGNPGLSCTGECSGHCKLFVKIPGDQFNRLAVKSLGIDLSDDIQTFGDITSDAGCIMTTDNVDLRSHSNSTFVRWSDDTVLMLMRNQITGSFSCVCSKDGSCSIEIREQSLVCKGDCAGRCNLVIKIPKISFVVA